MTDPLAPDGDTRVSKKKKNQQKNILCKFFKGRIKSIKQKLNCIIIEHCALDLQLMHDAAVLGLNAPLFFLLHLISILVYSNSIYSFEHSRAGPIFLKLI